MPTIWKFPVKIEDEFTVAMPRHAKVLSVAVQYGEPVMWAVVDPTLPKEPRVFRVVGTGHPLAGIVASTFVGTFQLESFGLVFHLFDMGYAKGEGEK